MIVPESAAAGQVPPPGTDDGDPLLSHEQTIELVARARGGDMPAMEALLQRCLPPLKQLAHGRLPAAARGRPDTGDLAHEAARHVVGNLGTFEPPCMFAGVALPGVMAASSATGMDNRRVSSRDRSNAYLVQFTCFVDRPSKGNLTTITLGETTDGVPPPVKTWFPQSGTRGREFIYNR